MSSPAGETAGKGAAVQKEELDKAGRSPSWWKLPGVEGVPLEHHTDRYGSAVVEDPRLNGSDTSPEIFSSMLATSMDGWRAAGVRAIWLRLATPAAAELLAPAIRGGFTPHHAASDHVTLTAWLGKGPSRLPPGPSHFIGVAGFVVDFVEGRPKVLVIQEKSGPAAGIGLWKLPGGLVDPKEDISVAAAREVWEETGIKAKFQRLCTIQENHEVRGPGREGSTDLYCIAWLTPEVSGAVPVAQESEIAACQWIDFEDLLAQPVYSGGIMRQALESALCVAQGSAEGFQSETLAMTFRPGSAILNHPPASPV